MINLSVMDYRIKNDERGVILCKVRRDDSGHIKYKEGKELIGIIGYYNTIEQALKGIMKHHTFTNETEITTLKKYRHELQKIVDEFDEKLKLESEQNGRN